MGHSSASRMGRAWHPARVGPEGASWPGRFPDNPGWSADLKPRAMRRGRSSAVSRVDPPHRRRIERDVSGRRRPRQRAQHLKEEAAPAARATLAMPAGTRRCGAGASRARSQAQLEHRVRDADTTLHDADRRVTDRVRVSPAGTAAAVIAAGCCVPDPI